MVDVVFASAGIGFTFSSESSALFCATIALATGSLSVLVGLLVLTDRLRTITSGTDLCSPILSLGKTTMPPVDGA